MPTEKKLSKAAQKLHDAMMAAIPVATHEEREPIPLPEGCRKKEMMAKRKNIDLSTWTETEQVILRRRSVRAYQKKQVPENLVRRVLEAGRYSPTAGNNMHWRFMVVRDPQIIDDMAVDVRRALSVAGKIIDYRTRPYIKPLIQTMQFTFHNELHPVPHGAIIMVSEGNFDPFWGAPTVLLLFKDTRGIGNPDLDLGMAGQNMVLAAHSMGLGTCWIGIVKALRAFKKWRDMFEMSYPFVLEAAICLGYPIGEPDGFVLRETLATKWFEADGVKTVY